MTFEQLFRGRLALMRAQRHLNNRAVIFVPGATYRNPTSSDYQAYFILERLLVDLEREFETKRKRKRKAA
jgi:hypothetical protein